MLREQKQIPGGNDRQKNHGNSKCRSRSPSGMTDKKSKDKYDSRSFAVLRMTTGVGIQDDGIFGECGQFEGYIRRAEAVLPAWYNEHYGSRQRVWMDQVKARLGELESLARANV
jgi:hypothetical protein